MSTTTLYALLACTAAVPIGFVVGGAQAPPPAVIEAPPPIERLAVTPSDTLRRCQRATVATGNKDDLAYEWTVDQAPPDAQFRVVAEAHGTISFFPRTPGQYTLRLTTEDAYGVTASRAIPFNARGCE